MVRILVLNGVLLNVRRGVWREQLAVLLPIC